MKLTSPAFSSGETIPTIYTQFGDNISPPLEWFDIPDRAGSLALIVEDPDAPNGVYTHWLIYNIPTSMKGLDSEVPPGSHYGTQILQGKNEQDLLGYLGPKPPDRQHRYIFDLYALDGALPLEEGATKEELLQAMHGHIIDQAKLTGLYSPNDVNEGGAVEDAYDLSARQDIMQPEAKRP